LRHRREVADATRMRMRQRNRLLGSAQAATIWQAVRICSADDAARDWFAGPCTASAVETPLTPTRGSATGVASHWGDFGASREEEKL